MKGRCCVALSLVLLAMLWMPNLCHSKNAAVASSAGGAETPPLGLEQSCYTVRKGDNLIRISRSFNTSPEALKSANGLRGSKILIGQRLKIPESDVSIARTEALEILEASLAADQFVPPILYQQGNQAQYVDAGNEPRRLQLAKAGFEFLGVKYKFGGHSEKYGFDCSGLVKNLFSKFGIDLPHSSREQFKQGEKVDRDKLETGDLVFFSSGGKFPTHVGIYIGDDKFLHAAHKARKVIVSDLNKIWYSMRYLGARRINDLCGREQETPAVDN